MAVDSSRIATVVVSIVLIIYGSFRFVYLLSVLVCDTRSKTIRSNSFNRINGVIFVKSSGFDWSYQKFIIHHVYYSISYQCCPWSLSDPEERLAFLDCLFLFGLMVTTGNQYFSLNICIEILVIMDFCCCCNYDPKRLLEVKLQERKIQIFWID